MAKDDTITKMEQYIQVNGQMINSMVKELKHGQMDLNILEITSTDKKMDMEDLIGMMEVGMKVNLKKTI